MLQSLLEQADRLPVVSATAAKEYQSKLPLLVKFVDDRLAGMPFITGLVGHSPLRIMFENHLNHAYLMANVFRLNCLRLLVPLLPWVYRAYHSRGFAYEYFPLELRTWIEAMQTLLSPPAAGELRVIYDWMLANHGEIMRLADDEDYLTLPANELWDERAAPFLGALLRGRHAECLSLGVAAMAQEDGLAGFYLNIVQPAMYRLGAMWERGQVSVAQEHMATSVVTRVMAGLYQRLPVCPQSKGRAVVAGTTNEQHEIGARMMADLLEQDGWAVTYLGAGSPVDDMLGLVAAERPQLLAICKGRSKIVARGGAKT